MADQSTSIKNAGPASGDSLNTRGGQHLEIIKAATPPALLNMSKHNHAALKSFTPALPDWLRIASQEQRAEARRLVEASVTAHTALSEAMAGVTELGEFAEPLLKKKIREVFAVELDVNHTHVRLTESVGFLQRKSRYPSLLEAALHNFGSSDQFLDSETYAYGANSAASRIALDVARFAELCRELDIGKQYQAHIKNGLKWNDAVAHDKLRDVFVNYQKAALKASTYIALRRGDIQLKHQRAILQIISGNKTVRVDGKPLWCRGLSFMRMPLHGCIVFEMADPNNESILESAWDKLWPTVDGQSKGDFIAYIPDDPDHPVKHYATVAEFKARLISQFVQKKAGDSPGVPTVYQRFFSRFVRQKDRAKYFYSFTEQVPTPPEEARRHIHYIERRQKEAPDFLLQFRVLDPSGEPWQQHFDIWATLYKEFRNGLLRDARSQAVSTEDADVNERRVLIADLLDSGLTALNLLSFAVPPLGAVMLGVAAVQLMYEVVEGLDDLSLGDKEAGWQHINDVLQNIIVGAETAPVFALVHPDFIPIELPNGGKRLWKPDLGPYRSEVSLEGIEPNAQGQYPIADRHYVRIDGDVFETRLDPSTGQWRVVHPTNAAAYQPVLKESSGVWRHTLDNHVSETALETSATHDVNDNDVALDLSSAAFDEFSNTTAVRYSLQESVIAGLSPVKGIYRSLDGQRFYIRNIDESGTTAVYQVRGSFNLTADTVDVNVVDPGNDASSPLWLWQAGPDQWQPRSLKGGASERRLIKTADVRDWSRLPPRSRQKITLKAFARDRGLFLKTLERYVLADGTVTAEGADFLASGNGSRNKVTATHLSEWERLTARQRHELTREGFANRHRLDTESFMKHVKQDGTLDLAGKALAGKRFNRIIEEHLQDWYTLSQLPDNDVAMMDYVERNNLNPLLWERYVKSDGSFTVPGNKVLVLGLDEFAPVTYEHLKRWWDIYHDPDVGIGMNNFLELNKIDPLEWAHYVNEDGRFTPSGTDWLIFGDVDESATVNRADITSKPPMARKSLRRQGGDKRTAEDDAAEHNKRRRLDDRATESGSAMGEHAPQFGHQIDNRLPILQDPNDVTRSITLSAEGPEGVGGPPADINEIEVTYWNRLLDDVEPAIERMKWADAIVAEVRDWIRNEDNLAFRFDQLLRVEKLKTGPERGLSVVANRDIRRFEVLGPYSGKLHRGNSTLIKELNGKGHKAVESFSFSTFSNDGTLSAHGSGNVLSLVNSFYTPGESFGHENVGTINVGRYMTFFVAWQDIEKGEELLLDYGPAYKWD
ncbi:hypothetical protein PS914_00356 [Pseudomonas fluorescens]|uniref:dermonecrotic toxin domain-containing protein n=1 Tax=Pseudomonas fluorescens TaxID=294 RepID=UPI0012421CD3|nr:DUF6543 domain-containing protein [Pseudomonas fluorescens]VVP66514.1 hypothetical protein PS914_00356 [Pseudomonas fluorescens]